jgi:hypothetical protein
VCVRHAWTRQGTDGFLGHEACQGQTSGLKGETSRSSLDPDGCVVRRQTADTTRTKTGTRLRPQVGGGVCLTERNGKKVSKVVRGEVLPLDKSLLMGVSPIRRLATIPAGRQVWRRGQDEIDSGVLHIKPACVSQSHFCSAIGFAA